MSGTGHEMQLIECEGCGAVFAVLRVFFDARVADSMAFCCPSGHRIRLGVESSTDRLLRQVTAQLRESTQALTVAREECETLVAANFRLADQVTALQATVVNQLVGPQTAQGDG